MHPVTRLAARLVLEDGSCYSGLSIGVPGTRFGELVFNTSMTGYQEILTDPSYRGQIILMTYPEIGNYGVNWEDYESERIHGAGLVVRRLSPTTSSWRAQISLQEFLVRNGVGGIEGVDTRALTRKLRTVGVMKAGITTDASLPLEEFVAQVEAQPDLSHQDLVGQVSTPSPYLRHGHVTRPDGLVLNRLAVVDYGIKRNILQEFQSFVREMIVLPAHSTFEDIARTQPDAVFLSNGPGDPTVLTGAVDCARQLIASGLPTFGICLGHQILALASGLEVEKMPFGHHGGNHPVLDIETGLITITSQNHNYAVNRQDLEARAQSLGLVLTHLNLNDQTVEGFRHRNRPVFSVQFHPEASPGPHDAQYLFRRFIEQAHSPVAVVS
jgi:carbamoyl-phosphate synthase small subunit